MFTLPSGDNRTAIIGSTGSGKTQFAAWLLSTRDFDKRPWVLFDFKGDVLLNRIGATPMRLDQYPKNPGLYIVKPLPGDEPLVSRLFYQAWLKENIGLYIDEGYMVPKNDRWFRACLTQGRSKNVEMIVCSQRPVFLDKFVWTESSYFAVLNLTNSEDRKKVGEYLNGEKPKVLPKYHSLWYDVGGQSGLFLKPVPNADEIVSRFEHRLAIEKGSVKL